MVWSGCITSTLQHQATAMICGSVMISSAIPKQNRSKTPFSWRHPCEQAVCTMRYPPKAPTFVTRQSLLGMHALRFFPSVSLGYWGKFFGWPVPSLAKDVRAGGVSVIGRRFRWDRRRSRAATWFPARSRAGARWGTAYPSGGRGFSGASGRSAPGAPPARRGSPFLPRNGEKEGRGSAPGPRVFMAARSHSLIFGIVVSGTAESLLLPVS